MPKKNKKTFGNCSKCGRRCALIVLPHGNFCGWCVGKERKKVHTDGWQPIETAPKDGTRILLTGGKDSKGNPIKDVYIGWRGHTETVYGLRGFWAIEDYRSEYGVRTVYPTHWMPLPEPPEGETVDK